MKKRSLALLMSGILAVTSLAGCSSSGNSGSQTTAAQTTAAQTTAAAETTAAEAAAAQEPMTIKIMQPLFEAQPPAINSPAQLAIEEKLNVKFEVQWVPSGTFSEVFNTTMATNDLPTIIYVPSSLTINPGFIQYCNAGVFWDLTDRLKNNETFWNEGIIDQNHLNATAVEDRNYMFPIAVNASRIGVIYRADWAEKVGAEPPTSVETFYEMARKFTEEDPDGNGVDDTFGFAYIDDGDKELPHAGFTTLAVAMGAPNVWGEVDGKITPYFETEEYMETLNLFKDMYDKGYMNEDFYLIKGNDKYSPMNSGKAGMMMTSASNAAVPGGKFDPLLAVDPNAKIAYTNTLIGAEGVPVTNSLITVGAIGALVFPKKSVSEEELDRIFEIIELLNTDEELYRLANFGVEGLHYDMVDGQISQTDEQIELRSNDGSTLSMDWLPTSIAQKDVGQKLTPTELIVKEILPNSKYAVSDVSVGKMDADMLTVSTNIASIISDARVKYITGDIDEEGFKAAVQSWKDAGGQELIDKLNQ